MCTTPQDPGVIRSLWRRLCGRPDPIPTRPAGSEPTIVVSSLPRCERCGAYRSEDDAACHRRWCGPCDLQWLEEQIAWPLVARMGRRGARKALKSLVRGEIR
jgi:hypothetical protein